MPARHRPARPSARTSACRFRLGLLGAMLAVCAVAGSAVAESDDVAAPVPVAADEQPPGGNWPLPDMAQEIRNPIAQLLQFPVEIDSDGNFGADRRGNRVHVDLKAIVPIPLGPRWTLISWAKVPTYWQRGLPDAPDTKVGLGNAQLRLFVSPAKVRRGLLERGFVWGLGPMLQLPATDEAIATPTTSIGGVGSFAWQGPRWTIGLLAYQVLGVAGPGSDSGGNQGYVQPYVSYTTDDAWSATLNTESTFAWNERAWETPINFEISKLVRLGPVRLSFLLGARYWAADEESGAHGWAGRGSVTVILPNVLDGG